MKNNDNKIDKKVEKIINEILKMDDETLLELRAFISSIEAKKIKASEVNKEDNKYE